MRARCMKDTAFALMLCSLFEASNGRTNNCSHINPIDDS